MISPRIAALEKQCAERGKQHIASHTMYDYHQAALTRYANLPQWEKTARSMAYAIENMDVYVYDDDRIGAYHQSVPVVCEH